MGSAIDLGDSQVSECLQLKPDIDIDSCRHAVGEEIVVYPLMEEHMGEKGLKLANEDRDEHQVSLCCSLLQSDHFS